MYHIPKVRHHLLKERKDQPGIVVNRVEQDEADDKSHGHLNRKLVSSPDADAFLIPELLIVIPKPEEAERQRRQQNDPDVGIRQVRPEEGWDEDGGKDEASSHRRSSVLDHVPGRNILPHHLLNLKGPQFPDQPGPDDKTDEKGGENRIDGPEGDIPEDIEEGK